MKSNLTASKQGLETLSSPDYWRSLCPDLHVDDSTYQASKVPQPQEVAANEACSEVYEGILEEGFSSLSAEAVHWSVDVSKLADAILTLQQYGWPPTFIIMYDEAWRMALDAALIMDRATHGNSLCMDIVAFLVDPARAKGFSPHRDRQPEDWTPRGVPAEVQGTFKSDGMAKYVTLWAALTDAHPKNSCLHFLPKGKDPGYTKGDDEHTDPMRRCFSDKDSFQNIRCEPVAAGGCTFHTHRTIHWGNCGKPSYTGRPRIALSFGFSTPDFEPPYFSQKNLPFPSVPLRASLAAAQVLNYATLSTGDPKGWNALAGSMANAGTATFGLLHRLFERRQKAFHATYRKEIAGKFVAVAMGPRSADAASLPEAVDESRQASVDEQQEAAVRQDDDDDEEDEDDALRVMLEAEARSGEILFHDDFDMLNGCGDGEVGEASKFHRRASKRARHQLTQNQSRTKKPRRPARQKKS